MTNYYGTGVGRHLTAQQKQFSGVVFQAGKPPVAEEFNLLTSILEETQQEALRVHGASGFITDPFDPKADYSFDPRASNMFWLGARDRPLYALVNGWVIPVAGTHWGEDLRSAIKLPKPDGSNPTIHFVFLEVWKAQISPDGPRNKPSEDQIYRYGNVEFGGSNLTNQILDPRFMIETTERQQLQYRIRVVNNVDIERYPYGFHGGVTARGPRDHEVAGMSFENMGKTLGDPGLWRAGVPNEVSGDGTVVQDLSPLDTVDGYVYAIPLCFVSRRRRGTWNINQQNQAVDRNPNMGDRLEAGLLPEVLLEEPIVRDTMSFTVNISIDSTTFPASGYLRIGGEIIRYSNWIGQTITVATEGRGARQTHATAHEEGAQVTWVSGHPLDLFADQIIDSDILDLRHVTGITGFSYRDLLEHNFQKLISGALETAWKTSEGHVTGTLHFQADQFSEHSSGSGILHRDRPDNFRKIFSDAAVRQPGNLLVTNPDGTAGTYTFNIPNVLVQKDTGSSQWVAGDSIEIPLAPLRGSFGNSQNEKVRFVHPHEYSDAPEHDPFVIWDVQNGGTPLVQKRTARTQDFTILGSRPQGIGPQYEGGTQNEITFGAGSGTAFIEIKNAAQNTIDFGPVIDGLIQQGAWLYIKKDVTTQRGGAYKIIGFDGGAGSLIVETHLGEDPGFPQEDVTADWQILCERCDEADTHAIIVLQESFATTGPLYINYDILYHPGQGLARVPGQGLFARMEPREPSLYVRENTFADLSSIRTTNIKDFGLVPLEAMPSRDRGKTDIYRNNRDAQTSIEATWAEAYLDRGSKTFLFQPLQDAAIEVPETENGNLPYAGGPGSTFYDFQLGPGQRSLLIPGAVLPPCGRQDLPFVASTSGGAPRPFGVHAIFQHGANDQIVHPHVVGLYDPDTADLDPVQYPYGSAFVLGQNFPNPALVCRFYDRGGVRGIELPPHFGVARLYGVYEKQDVLARGSAFGGDYVTPVTGVGAQNLLRTDTSRRSLIITPENTFVIPEDILDLSHINTDLSQTQLVFEFAGFMFEAWTEDWVHVHTRAAGASSDIVQLLMNGPAKAGDVVTVLSVRTPYQGNVAGTMPLSTSDPAHISYRDYLPKRGPENPSTIQDVLTPISASTARVENPAILEVLAALPFVTTLGTGRVSGTFERGHYTDVGYISQKGFPADTGPRKVRTRALECPEGTVLPDKMAGLTERLPLGALASDFLFLGERWQAVQRDFYSPSGLGGTEGLHTQYSYDGDKPLACVLAAQKLLFSDGTSGATSTGGVPTFDNAPDLYRTYRGGTLAVGPTTPEGFGGEGGGAFLVGGPKVYKDFPELQGFGAAYVELVHTRNEYIQDLLDNVITRPQYDQFMRQWRADVQELKDSYRRKLQFHGAVLFGIAMLVRTAPEEVARPSPGDTEGITVNWGGELQMLVATGTSFGTDQDVLPGASEVLELLIQLHPTGIGEGLGAADRYRIEGRPLEKYMSSPDGGFDIHRGTGGGGSTTPSDPCKCP